MSAEETAIVKGYEGLGMSPAEIAADRGLEEFAVKALLLRLSSQYRKDSRNEPEAQERLNFSDNELEEVNQIIMETARSATTIDGQVDFRTRLQAAIYVRDDKKGRKELNKAVQGTTFNILQLNQSIVEARKLREQKAPKTLATTEQKAIEV